MSAEDVKQTIYLTTQAAYMSNIELISYKEYPQDQYTKAIATIMIDGKHVVSYAKKATKTGNEFWTSATHNVMDNGEKVYVDGYLNESRSMGKQIMDFVRNVKKGPSALPTSMDEVAEAQGLAF